MTIKNNRTMELTKQKRQGYVKHNSLLYMVILMTFLFITSCVIHTKESYLTEYEKFINDISKKSENYNEKDWVALDKKHEKFTGELYEKYKNEFTWREEVIIAKHKIQYNVLRSRNDVDDFLNEVFDSTEKLRDQVEYYIENDMQDDIDFLIEQAEEVGESTRETVEEIIEELDKNSRELRKQ